MKKRLICEDCGSPFNWDFGHSFLYLDCCGCGRHVTMRNAKDLRELHDV